MSDCHPAPFGSNLLLAPASQISSDQLSTFSATNTDQSSPPYSGHDPQYSTPESHYNDRESPSSDQLNIDANPSDFSPEAETSSDRDESPDTDSTSSGAHDSVDIKTESDTVDLQREILRLQSFANTEDTKPPSHLNLLAAFNNQLLNTKFASNFLADQLAPKPATPTVAQLTSTLPQPTPESATPTKRKRQRRNPVWPYFDVIDGTAKCKQCLYTTKSVFSTNLKVHLRSHHRSDYEKVIAAEDALNLNALLMSGNASKFLNPDTTRKRIPPMTSSILMTINKLANQQNEDNPLHSVLRQTLAAGTMQQLQQQMAQQQQQKPAQIPLNAANLAALNNLARLNQNGTAQVPSLPTMAGADSLFSQFNFANVKQEVGTAPHGTDPNGMPQPKRRRLRRHPVWMFFRDLEDRMVGCINCNFRTGSAFSTNLKMHLKAHHKDDYERVLKLEDDMRMEEGIPNNKIKSELIDYIRGGGNASTPPSINSAIPKPSPLVQQFISQTMAGRTGPPTPKKDNVDDDPFNGMSMSDKLAALVGLTPAAGRVEGEVQDEKPLLNPLEEFKRTFLAANMGLQPPPQEQTLISLNGTILHSDAKSTSSASTDVSGEDKKTERDRALAKFWVEQGGNDELLSNDVFKILFDSLIPEETKEENEEEQEETSSSIPSPGPSNPSVSTDYLPTSTCFEISTLTYESLFDSLSSFEKSLGLSEASACIILTDLLKSSAKTDSERATVETVCAGLEKIASLEIERDKQERMRKLVSEKMKLKRLFETPDQRAQRLERMRARYRSTRTGETGMKKEKTDEETESAKEERLKKLREYQRRRLERELPEQRERRLAKMRMNQKLRRERQSKEKEMSGGLDLLRALAPDYDMPDASHLAALVDEDQLN